LNGSIFGISGFLHRAILGSCEAITSLVGILLGGFAVGLLQSGPPEIIDPRLSTLVLSGLLVGVGTKLGNGCTSGHMIAGLSRFSPRSAVATVSFMLSGVITTYFVHGNSLSPINNLPYDWTLSNLSKSLIVLQAVPVALSIALHLAAPKPIAEDPPSTNPLHLFRYIAALNTAFQFSLSLRLSNLVFPSRVLRFLITPFSPAFDPSLVFLALGVIPLSATLYHFCRGDETPRLGGSWNVPANRVIDFKLVFGSLLFGIGWGIQGICPGPAVVNFGTSLIQQDSSATLLATWLGSFAIGGLAASPF